MKNPVLIPEPHDRWIANILARFENGKPLNSDQLNFLIQHEKILVSHDLDLVFKYYLGAHATPAKQEMTFTLPQQKLENESLHEIKDTIQNLLHENLSHVDLKMSMDQYLQFKAAGLHELVFWHGPQFMTRTCPFPNATPQIIYLQWGKLFGVVKLNMIAEHEILDGYLLIYFEDMQLRSLNQCILDYASHHKLELNNVCDNKLIQEQIYHPSMPRPSFSIIKSNDEKENV